PRQSIWGRQLLDTNAQPLLIHDRLKSGDVCHRGSLCDCILHTLAPTMRGKSLCEGYDHIIPSKLDLAPSLDFRAIIVSHVTPAIEQVWKLGIGCKFIGSRSASNSFQRLGAQDTCVISGSEAFALGPG